MQPCCELGSYLCPRVPAVPVRTANWIIKIVRPTNGNKEGMIFGGQISLPFVMQV